MKRLGFTAASGIFSILGRVPHSDAGDVILPACSPHVNGPAPPQADVRPDKTIILAISTRKACAGNHFFRPMPCLRHEDHYDSDVVMLGNRLVVFCQCAASTTPSSSTNSIAIRELSDLQLGNTAQPTPHMVRFDCACRCPRTCREHVLKRVSRALSVTQHESQCPA